MTYQPGDRATWMYTPRGGYGYTRAVPCIVVRVTPRRVTIRAPLERGGTRVVSVTPERLRPRADADPLDTVLLDEGDAA